VTDHRDIRFRAKWLVLVIPFVVVACASPEKTRWTQPGSGVVPKPTDTASCRADANRRAEREFRLDTQSRSDDAFATAGSLQDELAVRDAKRYRQRIYEDCLRSLGYERVPTGRAKGR
jgi:hypothetical protein